LDRIYILDKTIKVMRKEKNEANGCDDFFFL